MTPGIKAALVIVLTYLIVAVAVFGFISIVSMAWEPFGKLVSITGGLALVAYVTVELWKKLKDDYSRE